jgi:DNA-directed RNA polymerase specialized sigma24 family protein
MAQYRLTLEEYLVQRGASAHDSEEAVQDFFCTQLQKRSVFARLQQWGHGPHTAPRVLGFLRACVLHHFIDLRRRQQRQQSRLERWQTEQANPSVPQHETGVNPLSYAWAVSLLQIALQDLRDELVGDPFLSASRLPHSSSSSNQAASDEAAAASDEAAAASPTPPSAMSAEEVAARLLTWRVFVEKFISPSVQHTLQGQRFTAKEIGKRLGLSRDQVMHRVSVVRDRFARHLRRVLTEACPHGDSEALFLELRDALILGSVRLPELLIDLPTQPVESRLDTMTVFSLCSVDEIPRDEVIDLLIPPDPSPDGHEIRELWQLVMRREYQHHTSRVSESKRFSRSESHPPHCAEPLHAADDGPPGTLGAPGEPIARLADGQTPGHSRRPSHTSDVRSLQGTIEDILFAARPSIRDLQTIKKLARDNGQRDHHILQQVYHSLYALAIARAKNACDQTITSLPAGQRHYSLTHAARYPWLPENVVKELELAVRAFNDQAET